MMQIISSEEAVVVDNIDIVRFLLLLSRDAPIPIPTLDLELVGIGWNWNWLELVWNWYRIGSKSI
jgi:hypothetical protein